MSPFEVPEGPYTIEKIMESIRSQVVEPQKTASAPPAENGSGGDGAASESTRPIVSDGGPVSRLHGQLELLRQRQNLDPGYRIKSHRPIFGPVLDLFKRLIHWGARPYTDAVRTRQEAFNEAVLQALRETAVQFEGNIRALEDHQAYIQSFMAAIHDLQRTDSNHSERMNALGGNIEELAGLGRQQDDSIQRHEKMLAEHHGNISNQESRLVGHQRQIRAHENRINGQQDRLDTGDRRMQHHDDHLLRHDERLEVLRARYDLGPLNEMSTPEQREAALDKTRGTYEDIRCRQYPYLKYFDGAPGQVLDVGCGRGEMLHMLRIHGVECWGTETDPLMIELCRKNGDFAVEKDALEALEGVADGGLGGIFAAQVIEHFFPGDLVRFIALARRKIAPGGVVILETLNPGSLGVQAKSYWRDLEHKQMIHPEYLKGMLELAGFSNVRIEYLSPFDEKEKLAELPPAEELGLSEAAREALQQRQEKINELLFGMQDYFVSARVAKGEGE